MTDTKPSDERNGNFLDKQWCCKVCDGEIPDGHTDNCDIWKLEKKHRDFLANEYSAVLTQRDALAATLEWIAGTGPKGECASPRYVAAQALAASPPTASAKPAKDRGGKPHG